MSAYPNILLIVVDCARSDKWLGPGRCVRTPNLDRLAGGGVAFPTSITEKSCTTPSFSTLLTGEYSPRHGVHLVWGYRLPESVPMLTETLARHGYHTYAEVSGPLLPEMGLARGFEQYRYRAPCDYLHTAWGDQFVERLRTGAYESPWFIMLHVWELHPHRYVGSEFDREDFGRDQYERAISSLDAQLGRVIEAAQAAPVPEAKGGAGVSPGSRQAGKCAGGTPAPPSPGTLIAFTGDHGEKTRFEQYRPGTAVEYARELLGVDEAEGIAPFSVAGWAGPSVLQELYGKCTPLMREVRVKELRGGARRDSRTSEGARKDSRTSDSQDSRSSEGGNGARKDSRTSGAGGPTLWTRLRDRLRLLRLTPFVFLTDLLALGAPLKLTRMLERRGLLDPERARRKVDRFAAALGTERLLDMHMRMWTNSYKRNYEEGHMVHVYDFLVRVPFVLHWPGRLPAGMVCERMVRQVDFVPTLLDLVGIDPAECGGIAGRSFKALIEGTAEPATASGPEGQGSARACTALSGWRSPPAFLSVSGCPADLEIRGVRTETHKYTYGPHNDELPEELYDLVADPGETHNLAAGRPELCAELRALADSFAMGEREVHRMALSAAEQAQVERQLHELGYL